MLDFTGRVAIVTGAGHGLGRQYALDLGRRGARVVVDDVATAVDGTAGGENPADAVAAEIRAAGGEAVAEHSSVADPAGGEAIVDRALTEFGRLDILVNNAGIARTNEFGGVRYDDVLASLRVHLLGAFHLLLPAWKRFQAQGEGVVVNTTSAVGMFGQRRSSVYAAGKMGVVGLTRVLASEGAEHGIRVNAIAPVARSRMAGEVYGRLDPKLDPAFVSAVVLALAHPSSTVTGEVVSAGGGRMSRLFSAAAPGFFTPGLDDETAAAHLGEVCAEESVAAVPGCAMDEIDLIRACYPDLADYRMAPR
ncbi:SDR family NAD(P)-dependent oxidoreductase [Amycolatopsis acidicola]|uniref:SDR family NAD(P)-dependent oxidoreductase n=1 Tax=Amycolatopsis acidicola TaxID=2596893 RepID=A0A5N0V135_9PSEU|nr:SDR family NAD(P)-dependent oxidoreductase [Amycolatopsis acidicola]KAA9157632.1 SDR family NAD(P)-dependent oxidoreductase [Amycolatopsis acidicola]